MGECLIIRRGGSSGSYSLPVLNSNYPEDKSITFISGNIATATFNVDIAIDGSQKDYTYQWYLDDNAVSGANSSTYTWSGNKSATHVVYCRVTNAAGTVVSRVATLTVEMYCTPTLSSSYPADSSYMRNNGVNTLGLTFVEHGYPSIYTYQWYMNGSVVDGATASTFAFPNWNAAGTYAIYCEVTNLAGTVRSRTATITLRDTYLFNGGNVSENCSGWIVGTGMVNSDYGLTPHTIISNTLHLQFTAGAGYHGAILTKDKIDLTYYSKIRFVVSAIKTNDVDYPLYLGVTSNTSNANAGNIVRVKPSLTNNVQTSGTYDVDISGVTGSYNVGMWGWMWNGAAHCTISAVQLIP